MPSKSPAPIYGGFEDLTKLIDRAEFIVVAEIIKRLQPEVVYLGGLGHSRLR
jgi:hypothetical protein